MAETKPSDVKIVENLEGEMIDIFEAPRKEFSDAAEELFGLEKFTDELKVAEISVRSKIRDDVGEKGYAEELSAGTLAKLLAFGAKLLSAKDGLKTANLVRVPEEGMKIVGVEEDGKKFERLLTVDEQDFIFDLELSAEQELMAENVRRFKVFLDETSKLLEGREMEDREKELRFIVRQHYKLLGFSAQDVDVLLASAGSGIPELHPGSKPDVDRLEIMKRVWNEYLTRADKGKTAAFAGAMMCMGAFEGIAPKISQQLFDSPDMQSAALFGAAFMLMHQVTGRSKAFIEEKYGIFMHGILERSGGLYDRIGRAVVNIPGEQFSESGIMERGRVFSHGEAAIDSTLRDVVQSQIPQIVSLGTTIALLIQTDWRYGAASLVSLPISMYVEKRMQRRVDDDLDRVRELARASEERGERLKKAHIEVALSGMRNIMSDAYKELRQTGNRRSEAMTSDRNKDRILMTDLIDPFFKMWTVVLGVALRAAGSGDAGKIIMALQSTEVFKGSIMNLSRQYSRLFRSCRDVVAFERDLLITDVEEAADKNRLPVQEVQEYAFELKGVDFTQGDARIIKNASFQVPGGAVVRLSGESGHGKTTLTKLITGYFSPSVGSVLLDGRPIGNFKKSGPESIYTRFAYLNQIPYVEETGTLRTNLMFGNVSNSDDVSEEDEALMRDVIARLGLTSNRFLKNGVVNLDESVRGVSGGERRRIGIARLLMRLRKMKDGGLVVLDEPADGLSEDMELELAQFIREEKLRNPKLTLIVVSHRSNFVRGIEGAETENPLNVQEVNVHMGTIVDELPKNQKPVL
ncbi:MAG: ABC transporter ATP-binding protein [bacterium]